MRPDVMAHSPRLGFTGRTRRLAAELGLLALVLAGLAGCEENTFVPPPPPEVGVASPLVREVTRYAEFSGRTEAVQVVELRARVEGILLEALATPGSRVQEGDVLFRIDPDLFVAERDAAAARVHRAEAELNLAEVKLDRIRRAAEQGAANALEVLDTEATVQTAAADLEVAQRELAIKQLSVNHTEITAPLTGEIEAGAPDIGSLVGRAGSGPLTRIYDTSSVRVWVSLADRVFLESVPTGSAPGTPLAYPIEVATEADEGFPHHGVIDYIDPSVDPETGTIRVRATIANPAGRLKPGLFVRCRVVAELIEGALLIPEVAIGQGQIGSYVMVLGEDGLVRVQPVSLGPRDGSLRVIESGLDATDRVIIRGILRARPGQPVVAVEEPIATSAAENP